MTRLKMLYLAIVTAAVVTAGWFGWKLTSRAAYESAEYTVIESDGSFEIREYPELMLATTSMQFDSQGDDGSFVSLFRYISGANSDQQKVAMTTPVFMESDSASSRGQMGFVIPSDVTASRIPQPTGDDIQIRRRAAGRFAVYRFAGRIDNESVTMARLELAGWMSANGLVSERPAEFAGYDPPWTPGPMRRNEILMRLVSIE